MSYPSNHGKGNTKTVEQGNLHHCQGSVKRPVAEGEFDIGETMPCPEMVVGARFCPKCESQRVRAFEKIQVFRA